MGTIIVLDDLVFNLFQTQAPDLTLQMHGEHSESVSQGKSVAGHTLAVFSPPESSIVSSAVIVVTD